MKQLVVVLIASLAAAACATGYHPGYRFNEIQVYNRSGDVIQDIGLRVVDSPRTLNCDSLAQNAICYDLFGSRNYPQRGIELSWTRGDGERVADTVNADVPAYFPTGFPLRVVLEIREDDTVKVIYEQEEPGRDGGGIFING